MKTRTLSPMKNLLAGLGLIVAPLLHGQMAMSSDAKIIGSAGTVMAFSNNLNVSSDAADFSNITVVLAGASQDLRMSRSNGVVTLGGLIVGDAAGGNGGTKNFYDGAWEINGDLEFNDGLVIPQTGSNGKLVHTLSNGLAGSILVNNPDSYVRGSFYSRGSGTRFFPIGNSSGYFPSQLGGVTQGGVEVGMSVVNTSAGFTTGTDIPDIFSGQHWVLEDASNSFTDAFISLSTLGAGSYIDPNTGTIVVGGTSGASRVSLDGTLSGDFVSSGTKFSVAERIFTIGKVSRDQVSVRIRNVITPFRDNANDFLEIENIQLFPDNKVRILDRWGVQVKEWSGFTNFDGNENPDMDLSGLATGNYIVILEYKDTSSLKKLSQMVTLINQ